MRLESLTDRNVAWIGIAVLAAASILYLIYPLARLGASPFIFIPNEGWNALHSMRVLSGEPLYPANDSFMFNNYPPISFYLVGAVGLLFDDNIFAGRMVSLAAIVVIAVNVGLTVRYLGGSALFGLLSGVLFIGMLAKSYRGYIGVNDPQLLAHAIMTTGFSVLTASPGSRKNLASACFLMVLAGFTKHNIFAMPLATTLWLLQNDRRGLRYWLALSAAYLTIGFALSWALYGGAFFEHLAHPRIYNVDNVFGLLGWLQSVIVPVALWIAFAWLAPADPRIRLVSHLLVAGGLSFLVTRLNHLVSVNSLFDLVIAAAIAAGVMLSRIEESRLSRRFGSTATRALIVAALCLRMVLLPQKELMLFVADPHEWTKFRTVDTAFWADVAFMRAQRGPALCEHLALCYRAGHQSAYDSINGLHAFRMGLRDIEVLRQGIAAGQYRIIQLTSNSPLLDAARAAKLRERRASAAKNGIIFYADER